MVLEQLSQTFISFFSFLQDLIFVIYTLLLVLIFIGLQAFIIWFYIYIGKRFGKIYSFTREWFSLNENKFKKLFDYK